MKFRLFAASVFVLCMQFSADSHAQGVLLDKGQSGIGIFGGYMTNDDMSGFGGGAGYSFKGVLDVGVVYNRGTFDDAGDLAVSVLSPTIAYYPLKQTDAVPFSVRLNVSYDKAFYSADWLDDYDIDMSASGYTTGVSLYHSVKLSETFTIVPLIGVDYSHIDMETELSNGNTISDDDSVTNYLISADFVAETRSGSKVSLAPGVCIDEDDTTFSLTLGYVAPMNN